MARLIRVVVAIVLVCVLSGPGRAADAQDTNTILARAIKALGGEEKLSKIKAASWKARTTTTFGANENEGSSQMIMQGLDHFRQEFAFERDGSTVKMVSLLAGDKGIRAFGDTQQEMEKDAVANMKRTVYLTVIPMTIVALKDKAFKVEAIGEEMVDGKPAVGVKVTAPDKKDFKLYFDKQSGLPVKQEAKIVGSRAGDAVMQETTYGDYKEMAGIQKATKVVVKRNGEKFQEQKITEFKVLDKVDPRAFTVL
jgi:hypothetical protein